MAIEEIIELATGLTTANLKHDKAELINKLAELKIERAGFIAKIQELEEENKMLRDDKENPLIFKEGLCYSADDPDNRYPYCLTCYETAKKRIHLGKNTLKCPVCGNDYKEPSGSFVMTGPEHFHANDLMKGY
ncbi:MAG: hypothetical protein LBG57_09380 [Treponema sp.]|jgi:hypothetical protein|nr:hypothetical protein [Treponema sp.]